LVSARASEGKESAVDVRQVSQQASGMHPSSGICSPAWSTSVAAMAFRVRGRGSRSDASADERPVQHLLGRWRTGPVICLHVRALFAGVEMDTARLRMVRPSCRATTLRARVGAAVTIALHRKDDRLIRLPAAQKVAMQRVRLTIVVDGASSCQQSLGRT